MRVGLEVFFLFLSPKTKIGGGKRGGLELLLELNRMRVYEIANTKQCIIKGEFHLHFDDVALKTTK